MFVSAGRRNAYCYAFNARNLGYLRMDLNFTVVLPKLLLLLRADILITEEYNASFSDKQSEFVPLLVRQILKL